MPRAKGRFARGDGIGLRGGIAELLKDATGSGGFAVDENFGGLAQSLTAEITRGAVAFDAIKERRNLDEFGPHRHETVIHDGALRGGGQASRGAGRAWLGHAKKEIKSPKAAGRSK